jgi:hypothetical protein
MDPVLVAGRLVTVADDRTADEHLGDLSHHRVAIGHGRLDRRLDGLTFECGEGNYRTTPHLGWPGGDEVEQDVSGQRVADGSKRGNCRFTDQTVVTVGCSVHEPRDRGPRLDLAEAGGDRLCDRSIRCRLLS